MTITRDDLLVNIFSSDYSLIIIDGSKEIMKRIQEVLMMILRMLMTMRIFGYFLLSFVYWSCEGVPVAPADHDVTHYSEPVGVPLHPFMKLCQP